MIAVFVAGYFCLCGCVSRTEDAVVARVNGRNITAMEMNYWMLLNRTNVYNYFYQRYQANYDMEFWLADYGGVTPIEMLRLRALDDALRFRVQQILAAEKGIQVCQSYEQMMHEMEQVNAKRKQRYQSGDPVYGPIQFTPQSYYNYVIDRMTIELKYLLAMEENGLLIATHFPQMDDDNQRGHEAPFFNRLRFLDIHYDAFVDQLVEAAQVEIYEKQFNHLKLN